VLGLGTHHKAIRVGGGGGGGGGEGSIRTRTHRSAHSTDTGGGGGRRGEVEPRRVGRGVDGAQRFVQKHRVQVTRGRQLVGEAHLVRLSVTDLLQARLRTNTPQLKSL
jgi:hypothetical protein